MLITKQEENIIIKLCSDKYDICINKIKKYIDILLKENINHNLIGDSTINNIWSRHVIDSLQLVHFIKKYETYNTILDLGSGAGFPAIILGIVLNQQIIMVEKSPVKANFLKKICNILELKYQIINQNINKNNINKYVNKHTIITSRAFKSIYEIFDLLQEQYEKIDHILILKGQKYQDEINYCNNKNSTLLQNWQINIHKSILQKGVVAEFNKKISI